MKVAWLSLFALIVLAGCQTTAQHNGAELALICADPANRTPTPGNLYYDECRALYPSTPGQLRNVYRQNAPAF